jgi:hypothetical protein
MSHLQLNQHVKALKESIAWLSGYKDATVEIRVDPDTYQNLYLEFMLDETDKPLTIHGVTIVPSVPRDNG